MKTIQLVAMLSLLTASCAVEDDFEEGDETFEEVEQDATTRPFANGCADTLTVRQCRDLKGLAGDEAPQVCAFSSRYAKAGIIFEIDEVPGWQQSIFYAKYTGDDRTAMSRACNPLDPHTLNTWVPAKASQCAEVRGNWYLGNDNLYHCFAQGF